MADLEANMMHLQLLHESIARFNENFASFLYGLNMSAFCVDFPEAPSAESFRRAREQQSSGYNAEEYNGGHVEGLGRHMEGLRGHNSGNTGNRGDIDATFLYVDLAYWGWATDYC